jgi:hypothetical protein
MGHTNCVNKMDFYLGMIIFGVCVIALGLCMPKMDALIQYLEGLRDQTKNEPDKHQD